MSHTYHVEYTGPLGVEDDRVWVKRATVTVPELTHYGYDGRSNYAKANKVAMRELMKVAKARMGLTGVRGRVDRQGGQLEFRPYGSCAAMFVTYVVPGWD